jgi:hypothetical protein
MAHTSLHFNCCCSQNKNTVTTKHKAFPHVLFIYERYDLLSIENKNDHATWNVIHKDDIKWILTAEFIP